MKIKLIRRHVHAGKLYQAGDVLTVNAFDGNWLIEIGVATVPDVWESVSRVQAHTTSVRKQSAKKLAKAAQVRQKARK